MNKGYDCFERINANFQLAQEVAKSSADWESRVAAEKYQREEEAVNNIQQLTENTRKAREDAENSNKKASLAIWIAIVSIITSVAVGSISIIIAHSDSRKSTEDIINAIQHLKGEIR
jgi:subtilase family serine protease